MALTIAIIGAGVSGMTTTKICLEASTTSKPLTVTVFEQTAAIGGLWRYRPEVEPGIGSCMASTIVNSSKEMTAFSDFPVPERFPNFMHNKWMIQYLNSYAESFNFTNYIHFHHQVESLKPNPTGGYHLTIKNLTTGTLQKYTFDAVAICTGHNHTAKIPTFGGQLTRFRGEVIHSHQFRDDTGQRYRGKRVVVVGVGNSAGDIAVELANVAEQVYLSSRRGGTWLINRTGPNGYPMDTLVQTRLLDTSLRLFPLRLRSLLVETYINRSIGHTLLGLRPPSTRFFAQHIMVNDYLPTAIHLGQVALKPNIHQITPLGVVFEGDLAETPIDVIILATGYQLSFPFLPQSTVSWNTNGTLKLYKHVFDPTQAAPERLAFIGLSQPVGSLPPIAELQARWFVNLLTGSCPPLPRPEEMTSEIKRRQASIRSRYGAENETRYTFQCDWLPYMRSIAASAGVAPKLVKYFFTSPTLWWSLLTKPAIPAQFRLDGPGRKPKLAKKIIETIGDRIKGPYKGTRVEL